MAAKRNTLHHTRWQQRGGLDPVRYACIICEVLFREFCQLAVQSTATLDLILMPQGLHSTPDELRARVQQKIAELEGEPSADCNTAVTDSFGLTYDAILLGYALCSNGVVGLSTRRTPLVIPRGHDCITLLLGSKETYRTYFDSHHGIYWYSSGWLERTMQPGRERWELTRNHYVTHYGEENADYLMEMEQQWFNEYEWATYINWHLPTEERDRRYTQDCAAYLGWKYDEIDGDPRLLQDMLDGAWDDERFLVLQPGECIEPSYDPCVLKSCAGCDCHGIEQIHPTTVTMNSLKR